MERPVVLAQRRGLGDWIKDAPEEVVVVDDDRLRLVLAHNREALSTDSPFFGFLGFWNALDVACEDYPGNMPAWIRANAARFWHRRHGTEPEPPPDMWTYLNGSNRDAIAHAVRHEGLPALDPDDPEHRGRLTGDRRLMQVLVEQRINERWGQFAVQERGTWRDE